MSSFESPEQQREAIMAAFMRANMHLQNAKAIVRERNLTAQDDPFVRLMPHYERIIQEVTESIWEAPAGEPVSLVALRNNLARQQGATLDIDYFEALSQVLTILDSEEEP